MHAFKNLDEQKLNALSSFILKIGDAKKILKYPCKF